jgi:hypothetical protein
MKAPEHIGLPSTLLMLSTAAQPADEFRNSPSQKRVCSEFGKKVQSFMEQKVNDISA